MSDLVEGAVELGLREEQRDAGEGQKELDGKATDQFADRHAPEVHANDPRQGERHHTNVQGGRTTHDDRESKSGEREPVEAHRRDALATAHDAYDA